MQAKTSPVSISNLRTEYHTKPINIDSEKPRLSWEITSPIRATLQAAYQIQVASSLPKLEQNQPDLWDSGMVNATESCQIEYNGKPLRSRQVCYWRVRIKDDKGQTSDWSTSSMWAMGLMGPSDWKAQFITAPAKMQSGSTENTPVRFRKRFVPVKPVARAVVYVTAAGLYDLLVNGQVVTLDKFTPGWTDFNTRIYTFAYDVTEIINPSQPNLIAATVGSGWFGLHHGGKGRLALCAQLHIDYVDGSNDMVNTDKSWGCSLDGPITYSDIYNGENYDARKEQLDWAMPNTPNNWPGAEVSKPISMDIWKDVTSDIAKQMKNNTVRVEITTGLLGDPCYGTEKSIKVDYTIGGIPKTVTRKENRILSIDGKGEPLVIKKAVWGASKRPANPTTALKQSHPGDPVRETQIIKPVAVTQPKSGVLIYDMGQNFSGYARLKISERKGQTITMRFGEMLNPDGTLYTANLRSAKATDHYICKGGGEEVWEPKFTFHGFRYVELTGHTSKPADDAITGLVLHSDCKLTSKFECSEPLLNKLYSNIIWGQRSNYLEVPTDCPQRDERLGWTGDAQVFVKSGSYNMDQAAFYTAWLNSLNDTQDAQGGYQNIAPVAPMGAGTSPAWGDAGVICPWTIYMFYGDTRVLDDHYDKMKLWVEWYKNRSNNLVGLDEGFGDWLSMDGGTPRQLISTAYFYRCSTIMAQVALVRGKAADRAYFNDLAVKIKQAFNKAFVAADGKMSGDTQTAYLMGIAWNLLDSSAKVDFAKRRLIQLLEGSNWHLATGFLGVNLILPVLTDMGRVDVAYRILEQKTFPSWLYPVTTGATTIWERWNSWTAERGFGDVGMNSFNHYAYGSCGEWMMNRMAGIDLAIPGFKRISIRPVPGGDISFVKATYDSIYGNISSYWRMEGNKFTLDVSIPANTTATVLLPTRDAGAVTESGKPLSQVDGVQNVSNQDGLVLLTVGSGDYQFVAPYQS
ncbi:MAG: family 78 glycoside hydrolase catalytic domain [Armatimonadota bacterium]